MINTGGRREQHARDQERRPGARHTNLLEPPKFSDGSARLSRLTGELPVPPSHGWHLSVEDDMHTRPSCWFIQWSGRLLAAEQLEPTEKALATSEVSLINPEIRALIVASNRLILSTVALAVQRRESFRSWWAGLEHTSPVHHVSLSRNIHSAASPGKLPFRLKVCRDHASIPSVQRLGSAA